MTVLDITSIPVRQVPTLLNALAAVVPPEFEVEPVPPVQHTA
ncbi:hypothetical protein [Hyalangium gracile]|nr:hypothetical protein [Hyalangium gracile]